MKFLMDIAASVAAIAAAILSGAMREPDLAEVRAATQTRASAPAAMTHLSFATNAKPRPALPTISSESRSA